MPIRQLTSRDLEILAALDRCPLTARQLTKLSATFDDPFPVERLLRRRLQQMVESGLVRRALYVALAGRGGAPSYYLLSTLGYRMLYGQDADSPGKRFGKPVATARQYHTHALSEFLVHILISAHQSGIRMAGFCRENSVALTDGADRLFPDAAFQLILPDGRAYSFFVELDNGTERIQSERELSSWERKLRIYEATQSGSVNRFRVLAVATRSSARIPHILNAARTAARNPDRRIIYGVSLPAVLLEPAALTCPIFRDHSLQPVALLPEVPSQQMA